LSDDVASTMIDARIAASSAQDAMLDEEPTATQPCPSLKNPNAGTKIAGNRIDIEFDPNKSEKVKKCEKIVHVQFVRTWADGKIIKRGDFDSAWKFHDAVTTKGGWSLDHLSGEKTPDYQQGVGEGKKNGGTATATMMDQPSTDGGDKGFYDPVANPKGRQKFVAEFGTFAYCMKGSDCGTWYEGLTWTYTKTWMDQRDAKSGVSKIIRSTEKTGPTKSQVDAFDKFNKAAKPPYKPCT
jgi:hypothetical protein